MENINEFVGTLSSLDWSDLPKAYSEVEKVLAEFYRRRAILREDLESMDLDELERRVDLSHETSTHFKFYLHKNMAPRFTVWLHDYKEGALRRSGYAEIPHDHRYWFSSLILLGGFKHHVYAVRPAEDPDYFERIDEIHSEHRRKGDVYTVDPATIHSISEIEEPTLTLIVRSRGTKPYSQTFDPVTRRIVRYFPFTARLDDLRRVAQLI